MGSSDLLLVLGVMLMGIAVYMFVSALLQTGDSSKALSWASGKEPTKSKSQIIELSRPLVHNFTLHYATRIKNPQYRKKLARLIQTSGLAAELNVDEFIGLQILWGIVFPIILFVLNFALQLGFPWFVVLGLGLFGYQIPQFHARKQKKDRHASVLADLPFFIDLLALSTAAGSDFIGAIQRIVDKADNSVLAQELATVLKDLKLGSSRAEALRGLADRLDLVEVQSFSAMIIDADATGASIATVLQAQSEQIRLERFVRAEKAGARASQAILIPMMIFILPAVFLMVFGPVVLQFFYGGNS